MWRCLVSFFEVLWFDLITFLWIEVLKHSSEHFFKSSPHPTLMIVLRFRVPKGTYGNVLGQYLKHVLWVFLGSIVIARLLFNIVCSTRLYAEPWAIWHVLVLVCATISKITPSQTINILQVPKGWPTLHATRWRFVTIPLTPCYRAWPPLCMVSMHNTMVTWLLHYFSLFCSGCVKKIVRVGMYHTDGHCHWIEIFYKAYPFSVCTCSSNHLHIYIYIYSSHILIHSRKLRNGYSK